jgi:DNA polymerase III alpha subunit
MAWLSNLDLDRAIFEDPHPINIYNDWCRTYDMPSEIQVLPENRLPDYVDQCLNKWSMPDEFRNLDMLEYLLSKLPNSDPASVEHKRVLQEYSMFQQRGMIPVLQFLTYLVQVCEKENIVLGVGRGSSVASYCLYLIGVHRMDSIKYDLDIKEFLK